MAINYHSTIGAWIPNSEWVPAPRYLLRRNRILNLLRDQPPGRLIEIGCGAGALLYECANLGYECKAVEFSNEARELAQQFGATRNCEIRDSIPPEWNGSANVVMSMEVLEHIEDDDKAMAQWSELLAPGGVILLGVPCHMSKWGQSDVWAGHFRRYERDELEALLDRHELSIEKFENYGFPLSLLTSALRNHFAKNRLRQEAGLEIEERTKRSGTDRSIERKAFPFLSSWIGRLSLKFFYQLQIPFLQTELGDGFLVLARKTVNTANK